MRLRLDKLVLSAGLALAMVATTIPVGAAVTTKTTITNGESKTEVTAEEGLVKDNKAVDSSQDSDELKAFYSALVGSSVADNVSLKATFNNPKTSAVATSTASDVLNKKAADSNVVISAGKRVETIEITATKTIDLSTEIAAFKAAKTKEEVETAADTFAKALASKTEKATTGPKKYNYGVYNVDKVATTATAKVAELAAAVASASDTELADKIAACSNAADSTYTQKTTYTVTSLPTGYSFDVILGAESNATNVKHTVYSQERTAGKTNEEITDITELSDGTVAISVTDFNLDYFLVTTTVSTADSLIFPAVEDELYTATIDNGTPLADYKTALDKAIEDNSLTKAAYLEITVKLGNTVKTETDHAVTFKITPPTDIVSANEGKTITWYVIRSHTNDAGEIETTVLDTTIDSDGYIVFSSDQFSDFALAYTVATETTTNEATEEDSNPTDGTTVADATDATAAADSTADSSTTSTTASKKTGDNSMMPLFMTTLLLALCAGSLAIYKEKKTN